MNTYEWLPTESAPEAFPIVIVKGDLQFSDGSDLYIPDKKPVNNGWAEIGSIHLVGEELKPIPVRLSLTWLSLTERKFYTLDTLLPTDQILQAFEEGIVDVETGDKENYSYMVFGMAPGGRVAVWLSGIGIRKEVGYFTARETQIDLKTFLPERRNTMDLYVPTSLEDSFGEDKSTWPDYSDTTPKKWDDYRNTIDWSLKLVGTVAYQGLWVEYFNGERNHAGFDKEVLMNDEILNRMPKKFEARYFNSLDELCFAEVDFDEKELYNAFAHFNSMANLTQREFVFQYDSVSGLIEISLNNGEEVYHFESATTKVSKR